MPSMTKGASGAAALGPEQRFLLWAIRAWVACGRAGVSPAQPVQDAFEDLGLSGAADALDGALAALACASCRNFAVHAPHCPALSDDEAALLRLAAAAQHHRYDDAQNLLGGMVAPRATTEMLGRLSSFGILMALGGVVLPDPGDLPDPGNRLAEIPVDAPAQPITFH